MPARDSPTGDPTDRPASEQPASGGPTSNAPDPREPSQDSSPSDELLPTPWPADIAVRRDQWQTGQLLPRPVLSWVGAAGADPITGAPPGDTDAYDWEPIANPDLSTPFGMVVSQTCDIPATGPGKRHPFVDISPLYRRNDLDYGQRKGIRQFKTNHLVALTRPPEDGFWIVDLRLTMPASKALLAAHQPLPAFADPQDVLNLTEALARKRRRPALRDVLSEALPRSLDDYASEVSRGARVCSSNRRVGLVLGDLIELLERVLAAVQDRSRPV